MKRIGNSICIIIVKRASLSWNLRRTSEFQKPKLWCSEIKGGGGGGGGEGGRRYRQNYKISLFRDTVYFNKLYFRNHKIEEGKTIHFLKALFITN